MPAASAYTQANVINAALRGVAYPLPTGTYVSLHTASPGTTGLNEVTTGAMPAYVRQKAEGAGAIGSGWAAPSGGATSNAKQMVFPGNNGASPIIVTHFAVWDAATGGNMIEYGALTMARTLQVGDVLVFDIGSLTTSQT